MQEDQEIITKEEILKEKPLLKPKIDVVFQSLFNQNHPQITKAFAESLLEEKINTMQTVWELREEDNPKLILTDKLKIAIISLRKAKEMYKKNKDDKKAQWMLFLDDPNSKEVQEEIMEKNEDIKEAVITVKKMSAKEKAQRIAFLREKAIMDEKSTYKAGLYDGMQQGIQQGMQQGIQQGIQQAIQQEQAKTAQKLLEANLKTAKKLLSKGMSVDEVAEITELTKEEVNKLQE